MMLPCMPLPPLDSVAVKGAGRSVEVVREGAPFSCGAWGLEGMFSCQQRGVVGGECASGRRLACAC